MSIAAAAVDYARHGWPVFPLRGKFPAVTRAKGGHGHLDASTDPNVVARMWSGAYQYCNIGCRVPPCLFVLDVDPRHGGLESLQQLQDSYGRLPDTLTTLSGRGDGGHHLYYIRSAGDLSAKRLGDGIDVKTHRGYVLLPPSVHPATRRQYRWVNEDIPPAVPPAWLVALLRPPPVPVAVRPTTNGDAAGRFSLLCLVERVNAAPEGRRNVTLYGACRDAMIDGNLDGFEPDLLAAAVARGLSESEVSATVASARRGGIG